MDPQFARTSSAPPLFEDGFGQRRTAVAAAGDHLEVLTVRDGLTASPSFESAVRGRLGRLADFQSEHFARVRAVERVGKGASRLALVSDHVPGVRLSSILAAAESHLLPVEMNAAVCLLRQLVHAIAVLHDKAPDVCHGAIGPERLIITPQARLVVAEYVFASAIEQLRYPNRQYWQELRVPVPRTFGMPHFDRRTDVAQVGVCALALIIGRPLADDEFPSQVGDMIESALALSADGALEPLPLPFRVWLQRAVQIDSKTPFGSAPDAWAELDRVLHYSDPIAEVEALKVFLARYHAAMGTAPVAPAMSTTAQTAPSPMHSASKPSSTTARPPAKPGGDTTPFSRFPSPAPVTPAAPAIGGAPPSIPQSKPAAPAVSGFWDKPATPAPAEQPAPQPLPTESIRQSVPAAYPHSRLRLAIAAVLLVALTAGLTLAARQFLSKPVAADGMGTLVVQTNPIGAAVDIDGQARGVTPLSLDLPPGRHTLKLTNEGNVRSMPVTIMAGGQVSQFIELPRAASVLGALQVRTEPAGAEVSVDGHVSGRSPLTVEGLTPGMHSVDLKGELGSMRQEVKVDAGATASLVVPMAAPRNVPVSGWIAVSAPVQVQIFEDARLIGTSASERIMLPVGRHQLQVVNEAIGYSQSHTVNVAPGRVTTLAPRWPNGVASFNAVPWAEVWVGSRQVGETPLGNVSVPIGEHEVIFRHPELGEKRVRAVVTLSAPAKVSVDMRQR